MSSSSFSSSTPSSSPSPAAVTSAPMRLAELKQENIRQTLEKLNSQSSGLFLLTVQWKDLEHHFESIRVSLHRTIDEAELKWKEKTEEIEAREMRLEEESRRGEDRRNEIDAKEREMEEKMGKVREREEGMAKKERELRKNETFVRRRDMKVGSREKKAVMVEAELGSREKNLGVREMELGMKEKELESKEKNFGIREMEAMRRDEEIGLREKELESREKGVGIREMEVMKRDTEVEFREKELESRKKGVGIREMEVMRQEQEVGLKEKELESREKGLEFRELDAMRRFEESQSREKELESREKGLGFREVEVMRRFEEVGWREKELDSRKKDLEFRELEEIRRIEEVGLREKELDSREKGLEIREMEAMRRMEEVGLREKKLDSREKGLEFGEMEAMRRIKEVGLRDKELEAREKGLEFREIEEVRRIEEAGLRDKELEAREKSLGSREMEVMRRFEDVELRMKEFEAIRCQFEKRGAGDVGETCGEDELRDRRRAEELQWREKTIEILERELAKRFDELELKEKRFVDIADEFSRRERELEEKIKEIELKEERLKGMASDVNAETLVFREEDGVPLDSSSVDNRANKPNTMLDGRTLQMLVNGCVYDHEEMCGKVIRVLQMSSDPADLVLDAMRGFYSDDLGDEHVEFDRSIVRKSCIFLLEQLMQMKPCIKIHTRERAMQLAVHWKRKMNDVTFHYLDVLGFLQLVASYGLANGFDLHELAELAETAAQHSQSCGFHKGLGATDKVSGTAPSEGSSMQLGKMQRINASWESLKEEDQVMVEAVQASSLSSKSAAPVSTAPIALTVKEKLNVTLRRDGALSNFDVIGQLSLQVFNEEYANIQVQVEHGGDPGIRFRTHPFINKEVFTSSHVLGLKDTNKSFPTCQPGDGVGLLKWGIQSADISALPLLLKCSPYVSGNEIYVCIDYEASSLFDLQNVVISVPLPTLQEAPAVKQTAGEWRYNSSSGSILEWSIAVINNHNRSGSMGFKVPATDTSKFFPILLQFSSTSTYSGIKVVNVLAPRPVPLSKYTQRILLQTENYQVL